MRIAVGSDHGGFDLKQEIIRYLKESGHTYRDFGAYSKDPADYPDFAKAVGQAVAEGHFERGILICGTGIGASISANKIKGIRAALCHDNYTARMSREHNDANVLCLGGRVTGAGVALDIIETWLKTDFSGADRHRRRVDKVMALEG